jgi:hypothetical protein
MSTEPTYPSSFWAYLKAMWYVLRACFTHPSETVVVNLETGEIEKP